MPQPQRNKPAQHPNPQNFQDGDLLWLETSSGGGGGSGNPYWMTGHVAMVFFKDGIPYVVEAVKNGKDEKGRPISAVREIPYKRWSEKRRRIWHGRIKDLSAKDRQGLVKNARKHRGVGYGWFPPSLDNYSKFSCSKLILVAAYDALGIALDDKHGPRRKVPCRPSTLRKSSHVKMLYIPPR